MANVLQVNPLLILSGPITLTSYLNTKKMEIHFNSNVKFVHLSSR